MKRILVIGDIMLDHYIYGTAERLSPEAPVPVVKFEREEYKLGGAGNVIANIRGMGAYVDYYGTVGKDTAGELISEILKGMGVGGEVSLNSSISTTIKQRIIANDQFQMIRIDKDSKLYNPTRFEINLNNRPDVIIIADYGKGDVSLDRILDLKAVFQKVPIIVDPYPPHSTWYKDMYTITPNIKEYHELLKVPFFSFHQFSYILKTKGKEGLELTTADREYIDKPIITVPSVAKGVVNVSGAGDTVVAVLAYCVANDYDLKKAVILANMCAGYVCGQRGTATVPKNVFDKFKKEVDQNEKDDLAYNNLDNVPSGAF